VLAQQFRVEFDISSLVDTVNVSKSSSNGKEVGNLEISISKSTYRLECIVNVQNVLRLSIQTGIVDMFVVDTIFFTTRDSNFHFKQTLHGSHTFQVIGANFDVFFLGFFRQVEHVRGKERFPILLEVFFVSLQHSIEPREQLFGTMVRVDLNVSLQKRVNDEPMTGIP
jgi:hypothetical protein